MTLNGVMALFCIISENSDSFWAHCVKVHVRYFLLMSSCSNIVTDKWNQLPEDVLNFHIGK